MPVGPSSRGRARVQDIARVNTEDLLNRGSRGEREREGGKEELLVQVAAEALKGSLEQLAQRRNHLPKKSR